jgi:hypothetical protein
LYYPDLETGVVFATCSTALDQFFAYLTHLRNLENFDGVDRMLLDRMLLEHAFEYDVFFLLVVSCPAKPIGVFVYVGTKLGTLLATQHGREE